jgi:hypothetical protein
MNIKVGFQKNVSFLPGQNYKNTESFKDCFSKIFNYFFFKNRWIDAEKCGLFIDE